MSPALADRLLTTGQPENSPNSTLKCCTQNLMCSETQQRGTSLKEAWVRPTWWFWRSFQRGKVQWGSSWGLESWQQKFGGAYSTAKTLVLTSTILESSLCLIRAEGLPAHQQAPPSPRTSRMWSNLAGTWPHPLVSQHQTWPSWLPRPAAPELALLTKRASRHCTRQGMAANEAGDQPYLSAYPQ